MPAYRNFGLDSGVVAYDLGVDWIKVTFKDGSAYLYNYAVTGRHNVEQMKRLAETGQGLNAFINRTVRKRYAKELR